MAQLEEINIRGKSVLTHLLSSSKAGKTYTWTSHSRQEKLLYQNGRLTFAEQDLGFHVIFLQFQDATGISHNLLLEPDFMYRPRYSSYPAQ